MARNTSESPSSQTGPVKGRRLGSLLPGLPRVVVCPVALDEVIEFSEADTRTERGGFLLGQASKRQPGSVYIRHFVAAHHTHSQSASLTFTHETWSRLHQDVEEQFPKQQIVGWQHTHPRFGVFLSSFDRFIHRHFFREPWHVALVVDPVQCELGFFQWSGDKIVNCGFVVAPLQSSR